MKDFWKVFNEYHVQELKQREALYDILVNVVMKRLKEVEREMAEEKKMVDFLLDSLLTIRLPLILQN
jgi:hypothetical protein